MTAGRAPYWPISHTLRLMTIVCMILAALLLVTILSNAFGRIRAVVYSIPSAKLSGRMRLALVTDLHSSRYGKNQKKLMAMLAAYAPDAVLLCGDIFDSVAPFHNAAAFIEAVGAAYPCFFVFGNHEHNTRELDKIRGIVGEAGIPILEGDCLRFEAKGQRICIAGVDDIQENRRGYKAQLAAVTETLGDTEAFSVLLSHEPQFVDGLLASHADLIVSGHTHGGQWSFPGLFNGLYAPGQGLLPKYAGGLYAFGEQTLVISRGLSKVPPWVPRLFTPRELVFIDIGR